MTEAERERFIRSQTRLEPVPLAPEIRVYTASELSPLWSATQSELDLGELEPPFWAFPWAGGQALARHVLDHPELVRGKRVLDFASGSGLVALAARSAGASKVVAADIDVFARTAVLLNAEAAGLDVEATTDDLVGEPLPDLDVVLAGDVFYDRAAARRFGPWLRRLAQTGVAVLVGDPGRDYLPAELRRVAAFEVPVPFEIESAHTKPAWVLQFERPVV